MSYKSRKKGMSERTLSSLPKELLLVTPIFFECDIYINLGLRLYMSVFALNAHFLQDTVPAVVSLTSTHGWRAAPKKCHNPAAILGMAKSRRSCTTFNEEPMGHS